MNRGQHGGALADRAARSGGAAPPAAETPPTETQPTETPPTGTPPPGPRPAGGGHGRHCWVQDPPDAPGTWPGLLVEWRQREGGWHGRVAYTVVGTHGPVLVEAWLPAEQLKQS